MFNIIKFRIFNSFLEYRLSNFLKSKRKPNRKKIIPPGLQNVFLIGTSFCGAIVPACNLKLSYLIVHGENKTNNT